MNTMYYKHAHTHADLYWKFTTQIPVQQYKHEGMSEQREAFEMFINLSSVLAHFCKHHHQFSGVWSVYLAQEK